MHIFRIAILGLGLAAPLAAQAAADNSKQPAVDLSKYTSEMAQKPVFSTAYRSMAALPAWVRTGRGTASPTLTQTIEGKPYLVGHLCEPHNCAQNQFEVVFSENGKQAWGLLSSRRGKTLYQMPFGNPDDAVLAVMTQAYATNNPDNEP